MRIALLLLAFVTVLVAAAPDMETRGKKKGIKKPIRHTGIAARPAVQTPAPAQFIDVPAADAAA